MTSIARAEAAAPPWQSWLLLGVYSLLALLPLRLVWLPYEETLNRFLYEDFFYYLQVARQLVEGNGSTFDGTAPTNGYHPLWMLLSIGAYKLAGHGGAIYTMLTAAALLHLAQAYLIFDILKRHGRSLAAHGAAVFLLLNYRAIACNVCGLETPLQGLFLLLTLRLLFEQRGRLSVAGALRWGALLGLGVWARFDLGLLAMLVLAYIGLEPRFAPTLFQRAKLAAAAGASAFAVLVPWFAFSLATSGVLLPNSRKAVAFLVEPFDWGAGIAANLDILRLKLFAGSFMASGTANLLGLSPSVPPTYANFGGLCLVLICLGLGVYVWSRRHDAIGRPLIFAYVYAVVHLSYYALVARLETRYLMPFSLTTILLLGFVGGSLLDRPHRRWRSLATVAYAVLLFNVVVAGRGAWQKGWGATTTHSGHGALYRSAHWLRDNTPPGTVIAAPYSGILGYFSDREVVNTDGVVNDDALQAMVDKRLSAYVDSREAEYMVGPRVSLQEHMDRFSETGDWVKRFEVVARDNDVVVMRRTP